MLTKDIIVDETAKNGDIYDKNNEIVEDYNEDPTQRIFIDTSLYDDIRLVYYKDSKNIK